MSDLFSAQFEDWVIADCFTSTAWVSALVRVEVAVARAQASVGLVPTAAAVRIAEAAASFAPDLSRLQAATARDAFPIIGLLEQLRAHVGGDAAGFLHLGATTQDIVDNALVAQLATSSTAVERRLASLSAALAALADTHRATLMIARTHLQPAVPTTFGLKAAGWLAPLIRHRRRLAELRPRLFVAQCGGAGGTLASLGPKADAVVRALARELGLGVPPMPWHVQRDSVLEFGGWLALVAASVAKIAQDVLLLTQPEIGEVRESVETGGGSSAMPQKLNPVRCENALIAAQLVATHHAGLLGSPSPEHERGTQSGQLELVHLPRMCAFAGGALLHAERLVVHLIVDRSRLRANVAGTHGVLLAEAVSLVLARFMDRTAARKIVEEACKAALAERRHLLEIIRTRPEAKPAVNELPKDEADYLGSASVFIDRVLAEHAALPAPLSP